ncbi:hypothetical protein C8A03DRAFT_15391 [Achaetomium macrosporum]|uniref:Uncharacterized protein n=1 Tax=Achaetomium macrosporum TaxID=79813 RepID=A0AAN7CAR9_9PEZI|nr:hypothetical protein C8A03DRAFT_15391 [Achaetomium macrosporum]
MTTYHDGQDGSSQGEVSSQTHWLSPQPRARRLRFLDLPVEIRLRIYKYVLQLTPVRPRQLGAGYPIPPQEVYLLKPVAPGVRNLLSPYRPLGFLPSSLLCSCRQIYSEARAVPFHNNEFVFITHFSLSLSTACAFAKSLRPWQRDGMRFARLDLGYGDIYREPSLAQWEELCGYWEDGLKGLRLRMGLSDLVSDLPRPKQMCESVGTEDQKTWRWVDHGLRRLRGLRLLEFEIDRSGGMAKWADEEKVVWCEKLSERLNNGRCGRERTIVLCVAWVPVERETVENACDDSVSG